MQTSATTLEPASFSAPNKPDDEAHRRIVIDLDSDSDADDGGESVMGVGRVPKLNMGVQTRRLATQTAIRTEPAQNTSLAK